VPIKWSIPPTILFAKSGIIFLTSAQNVFSLLDPAPGSLINSGYKLIAETTPLRRWRWTMRGSSFVNTENATPGFSLRLQFRERSDCTPLTVIFSRCVVTPKVLANTFGVT
jgi:hypothetical protein